jgi:CheY-like chemotaxis protein
MHRQRPTRVLVVEDAADLAEVYRRHLTRHGCEVVVADTGQDALDLAPEFDPDLAFVDTMLPDMLGTSVVDGLRADARTAHCIVVIASGLDPDVQDTHGDAVMPKPFSGADIADILSWYAGLPAADVMPIPQWDTGGGDADAGSERDPGEPDRPSGR